MSFVDFSAFPTQKTLPRDNVFWRRGNWPVGSIMNVRLFPDMQALGYSASWYGVQIFCDVALSGSTTVTYNHEIDLSSFSVLKFDVICLGSSRYFAAGWGNTIFYSTTSSQVNTPVVVTPPTTTPGTLTQIRFTFTRNTTVRYGISNIRIY